MSYKKQNNSPSMTSPPSLLSSNNLQLDTQQRRAMLSSSTKNVASNDRYLGITSDDEEEEVASSASTNIPTKETELLTNAIFTGGGGRNVVTKGHFHMMMETKNSQSAKKRVGGVCCVEGCDGSVMRDDDGAEIVACHCEFMVCRECYIDAITKSCCCCPGCKELYKILGPNGIQTSLDIDLPFSSGLGSKTNNAKKQSIPLFRSIEKKTKSTYGYGTALWSSTTLSCFNAISTKPLSRKISVAATILGPYRLLIVVRLVALSFFLLWRLQHPNRDAMWLWGLSVVCEFSLTLSWLLHQLPKVCPVNRTTGIGALKDIFEQKQDMSSELPGVDVFVTTTDPQRDSLLAMVNNILCVLAVDYPCEKISCYLSDDNGSLLAFEALAEAASFAGSWVPFCRKHDIKHRNPESYFGRKKDFTKHKVRPDFVKEHRKMKREYGELKVRINSLPNCIRRRSDAYNSQEEIMFAREQSGDNPSQRIEVQKATWMASGIQWPGTWDFPQPDHSSGDHPSIIQVLLSPPTSQPLMGSSKEECLIDTTDVDTILPMLVYISRERRLGYDHHNKAGEMNALLRASAILSNRSFILNLDSDHYIYNPSALREAMCFMMDVGGDNIGYVHFPESLEGVDPQARHAYHTVVLSGVNMQALDGLQGPMCVGTGCLFRRIALYGFYPSKVKVYGGFFGGRKMNTKLSHEKLKNMGPSSLSVFEDLESQSLPKAFGNSDILAASIAIAECEGRNGMVQASLTTQRKHLDAAIVAKAINAISCWYENRTEWGRIIGWIYGFATEDIVTGYKMQNRGWRSVYCMTKRDALRSTAPTSLSYKLQQSLRWATGSVDIFFSYNNPLFSSQQMKFLQKLAYLDASIQPFTSIFLLVYCFLPALCLSTSQFIVKPLNAQFFSLSVIIVLSACFSALLEIRWSGITLGQWWKYEQFGVLVGTSTYPAAVLRVLIKLVAGVDVSFKLASRDFSHDENTDLNMVKWTSLMMPPVTIIMVNIIAIAVRVVKAFYTGVPEWTNLLGGIVFSLCVLFHLCPSANGLIGKKGRVSTIVFIWSALLATILSLWLTINPPSSYEFLNQFEFP